MAIPAHNKLLICDASSKIPLLDGDLPTRLVVMPWGENETTQGRVIVNQVTLDSLPANQTKYNFDRVALDFQHNTVPGQPAYKGEPAPVAAWAMVKVLDNVGIVYDEIEYTPEGETAIRNKHYVDLSPVVMVNKKDEAFFIHSTAICRQGSTVGLSIDSAKILAAGVPALTALMAETQNMIDYKKLLCTILGINPETATDADVEAAAKALGEKNGGEAVDIKALTSRIDGIERGEIIRAAGLDGKEIPRSALPDEHGKGGLSVGHLRVLVAELPTTVPVERRTPLVLAASGPGVVGLSAQESAIASQLGLSEAEYKGAK